MHIWHLNLLQCVGASISTEVTPILQVISMNKVMTIIAITFIKSKVFC